MKTRKTRCSVKQAAKFKAWILANKDARLHDFEQQTGGTRRQFYSFRSRLGLQKLSPLVSEGMKRYHAKKKAAKQNAEKKSTVKVKDSAIELLSEIESVKKSFEKIATLVKQLSDQNIQLRVNNHVMKDQMTKLAEMINGTPV